MSAECSAGNIPSGYKQTEVGVIPEDWEAKRIGAVCKLINGRGFKPFEWKEAGLPIIRIQNLNGSDEFNCYSGIYDKKLEVEPGQLLFAWSGSRGTSFGPHIWTGPLGLLNYHTWKIQIQESEISKDFLLHGLRQLTTYIEGWAHGASALVHVQKWQMENFQIPLPPTKAEQEAIAEALSDTDALVESLEQLIAKKRQIKQGAMQELLTGKRRLPGFEIRQGYKQTEVGVIPEDWEVIQLKDFIRIKSGFAFSSTHFSDKGPILLTPGNFKLEGGLYFNERNTKRYLGPFNSSMVFTYGDLLIVMTDLTPDCNLLGKPAFVQLNEPILHNQRIGKIVPISNRISLTFLYFFFLSKTHADRMKETATGSTVRHTSTKSIYSSLVAIPSTNAEQEAIATILSDMDSEITALEEKLAKARQIKQGMMQELLTGKIRLV